MSAAHMAWTITDSVRRVRENHPVGYTLPAEPDFWYWRCPTCEQWSPCDPLALANHIDPAGEETREQFAARQRSITE